MKPHELIARLISASNKRPLQVAKEMAGPTFQGTLHKFLAGSVASPKRATAETIAKYFGIPVEAIYNEAEATRIAAKLGIVEPPAPLRFSVAEPQAPYHLAPSLPVDIARRIVRLNDAHRVGLEGLIRAYLDAVSPETPGASP